MRPWLTRPDVKLVTMDFPDSLPIETSLAPHIELLEKGWLADLIGPGKVQELKQVLTEIEDAPEDSPLSLTAEQAEYVARIKPFLALVAFSKYFLTSNVSMTRSGPVVKISEEADPLPKEDRQSFSKNWLEEGKTWATRLSRYHKEQVELYRSSCSPGIATGSRRPTAKIIRGKDNSLFKRY